MLRRLSDPGLFELQQRTTFSIGLLRPAFGTWIHLRTWAFHRRSDAVFGKTCSLIAELFYLGIQELFARWIELQTTGAVFLRLHRACAGFARYILLCHLAYCLTRTGPMISRCSALLLRR